MKTKLTTAKTRAIIRKRYPTEGASPSLCAAVGLQDWQVRYVATTLKIRVNKRHSRTMNHRWNGSKFYV